MRRRPSLAMPGREAPHRRGPGRSIAVSLALAVAVGAALPADGTQPASSIHPGDAAPPTQLAVPAHVAVPAHLVAAAHAIRPAPAHVAAPDHATRPVPAHLATPDHATTPPPPSPLADRIDGILSTPGFDGMHWGIMLVDPADGRVLYEQNANRRFVPASNMKIPVTAAALALLGPEYRYRTGFYAAEDAVTSEGRVRGDLVLAGTGDPTLGEPFHESPTAALEALADEVVGAGIRSVEGALVVDAAAWDSTTVPSGWLVGNLPGRFAATGGAFAIGVGVMEIRAVGGTQAGDPASVTWEPLGSADFVESRIVTVEPRGEASLDAGYLPESRRWVLEGTLPPGEVRTLVRSQRDPVRQAAHALLRTLEGRGIDVEGGLRVEWDRGTPLAGGCAAGSLADCCGAFDEEGERCPMIEVAGLDSPPMVEIVRAIMEPSQNWMTEQLVRTLGTEVGEEGSWSEGFAVMTTFLAEEVGLHESDFYFRDGSGLAAHNLLTPRAVVGVLEEARQRPWSREFRDAMPRPGRTGTLNSRLGALRERVFAKTGSVTHVNALSGYLIADDGRELVFAILTNASNLPASEVRAGIDLIVLEMARPDDGVGR